MIDWLYTTRFLKILSNIQCIQLCSNLWNQLVQLQCQATVFTFQRLLLLILSGFRVSAMPYPFQLALCDANECADKLSPSPSTSPSKLTCTLLSPRPRCASPCDSAARASCHPRLHRRSCTRDGPHSPRCVRRGRWPDAPAPPPDPRILHRSSQPLRMHRSFRIQQLAPTVATNLWVAAPPGRSVPLFATQCGSASELKSVLLVQRQVHWHLQLCWLCVASSYLSFY